MDVLGHPPFQVQARKQGERAFFSMKSGGKVFISRKGSKALPEIM